MVNRRPLGDGWTRREVLVGALGALAVGCGPRGAPGAAGSVVAAGREDERKQGVKSEVGAREIAAVEGGTGGRVGVFAVDTGSGREVAYRADERFRMCSTFKWVLAGAVLARVDRGEIGLGEKVPFGEGDLLEHAPAARAHLAEGFMTVGELARTAITVSDNTTANLLLSKIGGPAGITAFARAQGDEVTRLDRDEPSLNEGPPGDPRDTTTPRAMVGLMRRVLLGDCLSAGSRETLRAWLRACETGKGRLRAGLPEDWVLGHKTGTGTQGTVNDVAIAEPPGRAPVLIAVYTTDGAAEFAELEAALAAIARIVAKGL